MKITPKIKSQINEIARIISYAADWTGEDFTYNLGCVEGAAFVASCIIVQDIFIPNGINEGLGTSDLIQVLDIDTVHFQIHKEDLILKLTKFLKSI